MEFSRITSTRKPKRLLMMLIKSVLIFVVIFVVVILIDRIDLPSPTKEVEKIIPNENLKIVK